MTQEDKQLLLTDLCARSYYWPRVTPKYGDKAYIYGIKNTNDGVFHIQEIEEGHDYDITESIDEFKVYLRPMSSMTTKERRFLLKFGTLGMDENDKVFDVYPYGLKRTVPVIDFLNAHHFDYRGLIPMGLALEAPGDMYKTE